MKKHTSTSTFDETSATLHLSRVGGRLHCVVAFPGGPTAKLWADEALVPGQLAKLETSVAELVDDALAAIGAEPA